MLKSSIVQRFEEGAEQRIKRCLPSDVQPHQSPELKKHSQATGLLRGQSRSSCRAPTCEPVSIGDDKPAPQAMVQQFLGPWPLSSVANMISPGFIFCPKPPLNSTVQTVKDSNIVDDDCSDFKVSYQQLIYNIKFGNECPHYFQLSLGKYGLTVIVKM